MTAVQVVLVLVLALVLVGKVQTRPPGVGSLLELALKRLQLQLRLEGLLTPTPGTAAFLVLHRKGLR